ncbi:MAG: hypothetical protein WC967_01110 [Balneolaceae bacterium]
MYVNCGSSKGIETAATNPVVADTAAKTSKLTVPEDDEAVKKAKNDYRNELNQKYKDAANAVTTYFILAQQQFFLGEYDDALFLINQATNFKENADILALKGSIYLGLGDREKFISYWRQALEIDANVPIPPSPYVEQQLKAEGLLNNQLQRNF